MQTNEEGNMKLLTTTETAKRWGISARRIALLCSQDRVKGAEKVGNTWLIPDNAEKPTDPRRIEKEEIKMAKRTAKPKEQKPIEQILWDAANKLRGKVEPAEYKHVVPSMIFLKYANDRFDEHRAQMKANGQEAFLEMMSICREPLAPS